MLAFTGSFATCEFQKSIARFELYLCRNRTDSQPASHSKPNF